MLLSLLFGERRMWTAASFDVRGCGAGTDDDEGEKGRCRRRMPQVFGGGDDGLGE